MRKTETDGRAVGELDGRTDINIPEDGHIKSYKRIKFYTHIEGIL